MDLRATLREPTGFSDPRERISQVAVVGFSYGVHRDANGYDRTANCMMAIVAGRDRRLVAVPIHWLTLDDEPPTPLNGKEG